MPFFLHTADWQIGRQYGQLEPGDAAVLAEARFDAVEAIARLAREREADAVLVAGDVFDMQDVSDRTVRRLFGSLSGFAGPWVMIAGNHDAALQAGVWRRAAQLGCVPANVHVPMQVGPIEFAREGLAVLAAPLTQRHTHEDVTQAFDDMSTAAGLVRVGLAHGSVSGRLPESADSANPIAADRAARARLDYLALGDWHGCLRIDAHTWYAGTPEPDRFRGNAPGHVLAVRIERPGETPQVEPVRVGRFEWHAWHAVVRLPGDVEALAARLQTLGASDVVQLRLEGSVDGDGRRQLDAAIGQAQARVRALRIDDDGLVVTPAAHDIAALGASGYVADVARQLQTMQAAAGSDATAARDALRLLVEFAHEGGRAE